MKCHLIKRAVMYVGVRESKPSPLGCSLPADGQEGGEWVWLITARAERNLRRHGKANTFPDESCGISSGEGGAALMP